jgi:hypothetical protein
MTLYTSKLKINWTDHIGAIVLWCIAIVCTLGFAAIPFQLWLAKLIIDNWEVEAETRFKERDFKNDK